MPRLEYDPEADALYISLREGVPWSHMTTDISISRSIDYGPDGEPIGIEFWNVHRGLNLDGVPERDAIVRLLEEGPFKVFA